MTPNYLCATEDFYRYAKWKRRFAWLPCKSAQSYKRIWLEYAYYGHTYAEEYWLPPSYIDAHWLTEKEYMWLTLLNVT
jgi:hypothetical protein